MVLSLKSPRGQTRPHGYVRVTQKAKLLSSWPQKCCCHGNSRDFRAAHAWLWILGPSLWARKVLSSSLSFPSLFPYASRKKKLPPILQCWYRIKWYTICHRGYLPMEHRSCPRENTRLLPFCLDCLTGRSEESQREPDFRSESQNFPLPWGWYAGEAALYPQEISWLMELAACLGR